MIDYIGLILLIAWAVNVWVFMGITAARPGLIRICIWAIILLVPFVGYLVWFLFGRKLSRR